MLDDRRSKVLQALIEEYIRTGEPVSSRAVLERSGLDVSSATIRNDLARLESYGFVRQPHPSAGRIPTQQGYRYYVDHCTPARLRSATRARIAAFFSDMHQELSRLLKETSGLLADLTHYPAVVVGPGFEQDTIHAVHLVRIRGSAVLLVTVAESGRVTQQVVDLGFEPTPSQLEAAERIIESAYAGKQLAETHEEEGLRVEELPDVVRRIVAPVHARLQVGEAHPGEIFVGGTSMMAGLWQDLAVVHHLLGLIEREAAVLEMLGGVEDGPTVRFGSELGDDVDMAVVAASFDAGGKGTGRVGVIGPTRMNYRRTMRVVEEVGEGLEGRLGADT